MKHTQLTSSLPFESHAFLFGLPIALEVADVLLETYAFLFSTIRDVVTLAIFKGGLTEI